LDGAIARGTLDRLTEHFLWCIQQLLAVWAVEIELAHRLPPFDYLANH
jgi:hypothetical protein